MGEPVDGGELVDRHLIENGPHSYEQPFTTEKTIQVNDPNQILIIRAHFSSPIGEIWDNFGAVIYSPRYPSQALQGTLNRGFKSVRIPPRFAAGVERQDLQPEACRTP